MTLSNESLKKNKFRENLICLQKFLKLIVIKVLNFYTQVYFQFYKFVFMKLDIKTIKEFSLIKQFN